MYYFKFNAKITKKCPNEQMRNSLTARFMKYSWKWCYFKHDKYHRRKRFKSYHAIL